MFSFRKSFLFATAVLATVASAAPLGSLPVNPSGNTRPGVQPVVNVKDVLHNAGFAVKRNAPEQMVNGQNQGINADGSGAVAGLVAGLTNGLKTRDDGHLNTGLEGLGSTVFNGRDEVSSLPAILVDAKARLEVVLTNLNTASNGKSNVDVQILVDIVGQVKVILADILVDLKVLVGQPIETILSLDGKVLAVIDVSVLLTTILSHVCIILTCVLRLVASASIHVVASIIVDIGAVLCELLPCVFTLVPGIAAGLTPTVGPIINLLVALKLDAVVAILKSTQ